MVREDGEKSVGVRTYRVEDSEESAGVRRYRSKVRWGW